MTARPRHLALALALLAAACANGTQGVDSLNTSDGRVTPDDKSATAVLRVADATRSGGDPATALNLYRRAHELAPKDPVPLARLGATLASLQAYNEAATAYRQALELAPADTEIMRGLASVMLALNQPDLALTQLDAALAVRQEAKSYSLVGVANDLQGHHDAAQRAYADGLTLAPDDIALRNNLGLSQALAGDFVASTRTLSAAAASTTATARTRQNLALAYGLAGDSDKAASVARRDLDEESVKNNLTYYAMLRGLDDRARAAAIIGAHAPARGANAETSAMREAEPASKNDAAQSAPLPAPLAAVDAAPLAAPPAAPPAKPVKPAKASQPKPAAAAKPAPAPAPAAATSDDDEDGSVEPEPAKQPTKLTPRAETTPTPASEPAPTAKAAEAAPQAASTSAAQPAASDTQPAPPPAAIEPPAPQAMLPAPTPQPAAIPSPVAEPPATPAEAPTPLPSTSSAAAMSAEPASADQDAASAAKPSEAAAEPAPAVKPAETAAGESGAVARGRLFFVQVGAFHDRERAKKLCADLVAKGYELATSASHGTASQEWHFCRSSVALGKAEATQLAQRLAADTGTQPTLIPLPQSAAR
jgi:Flp pilus assembly protein TadD/cell division septation protein DedD